MISVYINQNSIDGIRRVVDAQVKHLPQFGVNVVSRIDDADVACYHGAQVNDAVGIPSVHVGHGFMWSRQPWGDGYKEVNQAVVESMRRAVAHTAPSNWVNRAIRRGGYWYPETVYHGVDAKKFKPSKQNDGYVFWNKARADYVSDPNDMMRVSQILTQRKFVTTIGKKAGNVDVLGVIPHAQMSETLSRAGVYLATVRETFGIGVLEALASGVPVAGFDWGGNSEIILPGQTGYLVPPGDYEGLAQAIERCFMERARLSKNCVEDARTRWTWEPRIEQYANIFKRVVRKQANFTNKVSVIVTAYKLDAYLTACLDSIQRQSFPDFECLVVDDAQLDSTRMIVGEYAKRDKRFRYAPTPNNFGLPGARNFGISLAGGEYIRHMDADDTMSQDCLAIEVGALDKDRGIDIAYGHLETIREDGTQVLDSRGAVTRGGWPEEEFSWYKQMAHLNQLPSCVMARREVYERSGGYRERMTRNEDAEFWCRVTSLGFRAKKVTQAVTYYHRERNDSKGAVEWATKGKEPDWTAWFPWSVGAQDGGQGREWIKKYGNSVKRNNIVPFGAQGEAPKDMWFWHVHDYAYPIVSIIVTVGPGPKHYLLDALDSIQAQTYTDWECVVVNDTGTEFEKEIMGAPWAKVVSTGGNRGASVARNEGYKHITTGRYVVWMDADDYWLPWFLEKMVGYAETNHGIIYSDLIKLTDKFEVYKYDEFDPDRMAVSMRYPGSSVLIPRAAAHSVMKLQGGWDESIPGMEDFDFQIAMHHSGFCAYHVPEPLFVYRMYSSTKRESDYAKIEDIRLYLNKKWKQYREGGEKPMCGCRSKSKPRVPPASTLQSSGTFSQESVAPSSETSQMVSVEYFGPITEPFSIRSRVDRNIIYKFGNSPAHSVRAVLNEDAQFLIGMRDGNNNPTYRVVGSQGTDKVGDPSAFLGQPIAV